MVYLLPLLAILLPVSGSAFVLPNQPFPTSNDLPKRRRFHPSDFGARGGLGQPVVGWLGGVGEHRPGPRSSLLTGIRSPSRQKLVAQRHQLIHLGHNPPLLGKRGKWHRNGV